MQNDVLEDALKDINIIKSFIGENKNPYLKLSKFLLFIGIFNLLYYAALIIGGILIDVKMLSRFVYILSTVNAIIYFLLLIYFIKIYKEENKSLNTYYLSFLSIIAGIILILPLLTFLTRLMIIFIGLPVSADALLQLDMISNTANILLFCIIVILCGFILRRRIMLLISAAIFLAFLIISTFDHVSIYTLNFPSSGYLFSIYYSSVVSVGYIIIASVLRNRYKVEKINENR